MSRRTLGTRNVKQHFPLPKTVFVTRQVDDDSAYLLAYETPESIDDQLSVGVYELQEVKVMHVTHSLETRELR